MISPPYLKAGDKIGVVSTAKRTTPEEIEHGLDLLKSWGLVPVLGKNIYNTHGFFAGTDEERLEDLQEMLGDDSLKAIIFTKGAYGTLRIINRVDFTKFRERPKWIAGYSDITALHHNINKLGIETIHSVMLQGMPTGNFAATETLRAALFGEQLAYSIPLDPNNNTQSPVSGVLTGGNLSMLYALLDSDSDLPGNILFFEDIDEYLYHFDRMIVTLKNRGKLEWLKAILVGGLIEIKESTIPFGQNAHEVVLQHAKGYGLPVYFGFPSGHMPDNRALILGRTVHIKPTGAMVEVSFADQ